MNKKGVLSLLCSMLSILAFAQNLTKEFQIAQPLKKVDSSFYRYAEVLDSRLDTSNFGIVQRGAFNRKARLIAKPDITTQLTGIINYLADSASGRDTILIQLRHMDFAELTGSFSEKGYCYFRTTLYARKDGLYYRIAEVDTTLLTKSMDVTAENIRKGGNFLVDFIGQNLSRKSVDPIGLTKNDLENIDSIEKLRIPLYTNAVLQPGVYNSYNSFKNQTPDFFAEIEPRIDENVFHLKAKNAKGKWDKLNASKIYAVVTPDQSFVGTPTGFYQLTKNGNDFHFIGRAKVTASTGQVLTAGLMFGLVGSLLASDATELFSMKIDHYNGNFIKLKLIKQPSSW